MKGWRSIAASDNKRNILITMSEKEFPMNIFIPLLALALLVLGPCRLKAEA